MYRETDRFPFIRSLVGQTELGNALGRSSATLAIQSRGEMAKEGQKFLASRLGVDLEILDDSTRKLVVEPQDGIRIFKLRPPDIIRALHEGVLDMAILGADYIWEDQLSGGNLVPIERLGFGACTFSIGFPFIDGIPPTSKQEIQTLLQSGIIVTSLPKTLRYVLNREDIVLNPENIRVMEGSVEAGLTLFGAVAIADRVSTGNTMLANGIRPDLDLIEFPGAYLVTSQIFIEKQEII